MCISAKNKIRIDGGGYIPDFLTFEFPMSESEEETKPWMGWSIRKVSIKAVRYSDTWRKEFFVWEYGLEPACAPIYWRLRGGFRGLPGKTSPTDTKRCRAKGG